MKKWIAGILGMVVVAGCADKNIDDWRRKMAGEDFQKIKAQSGDYRGALLSNAENAPIATLTVHFEPVFKASDSTSRPTSEEQATVDGYVSIEGDNPMTKGFTKAAFDTAQNELTAELNVDGRGIAHILASVNSGKLTGTLQAAGFLKEGAHFELYRADSQALVQPLPMGGAITQDQAIFRTYTAMVDGAPIDLLLARPVPQPTNEQDFYDSFVPTRIISVTVHKGRIQDTQFNHVIWDRRTRHLTGSAEAAPTGVSAGYSVTLECSQVSQGTQMGWDCRYISVLLSPGEKFHAVFLPKPVRSTQ